MPQSFDLINKVEQFLRRGTFPVDASKSSKKVIGAASKHFTYKDGCLWRAYRGRLLRVVKSDEEVKELMVRYHDNNNHPGRVKVVRQIMLMYYWVGVTEAVKSWIKACAVCQSRGPCNAQEPYIQHCLAYGCDASSFINPELSFHRFPKEAEQRRRWLAVAQRDEGSLRSNSYLCSRHFEPSCFTLSQEGQWTLSPDAIPTIIPVTVQEDEVAVPSDDDFLHSNSLEDLLSTTAATETTETPEPAFNHSETPVELKEHQYCLPVPDPDCSDILTVMEDKRRKTTIEPSFTVYNQIARYLSHRVLPMQSRKSRGALIRMAKRFGLIDGVLMYTRVSPPLRVPLSREEVNSILQQFHDNQGHYSQGFCQREIGKRFHWASMTRDLARWISSCHTCLKRTKCKGLRCSISSCTNCCGPVERGLGITFHKFPLVNLALLAQWLRAAGRANWHPRLWSSVCSIHFTEECFDRSGENVTVHPDAVPTLFVHSDSATASRVSTQLAVGEEAYFAKYDAVERYLSRRTYPPGLSYVEKNTFRRFCKKFVIKDDVLHIMMGERVCLVLRSRQQVEAALVDYHDELNHLDINKCLRLLNERYFWKTMRPDVVQWINNCSQCRGRKKKRPNTQTEPGRPGCHVEAMRSPQIPEDTDSGRDEDEDDGVVIDEGDGVVVDEGDGVVVDEGCVSIGDEEQQPATDSEDRVDHPLPLKPVTPTSPQPRIPILIRLRTAVIQPVTSIIVQPSTPDAPVVARLQTNGSDAQNQSDVQIQVMEQTQAQEVMSSSQGSTRAHHFLKVQDVTRPLTELHLPSEHPKSLPQATTSKPPSQGRGLKSLTQSHGTAKSLLKRTRDLKAAAKRSSSCGLEPVAHSTKPWPVFTFAGPVPTQTARPLSKTDSPTSSQRRRRLQARVVIQQCSKAKVKIKPALDGADAQWVEIQEGMVVYVCFFHGATSDITHEMASSLMNTTLFRTDNRRMVSVLNLPGSVLFIPQDSLVGQVLSSRRVQYRGGCEPWWGAQLLSNLVSACREFMSGSEKSTKAGTRVEQGVYGQRQEVEVSSVEPLTLLMEF